MQIRIIDAARRTYLPSPIEVWKHRELTFLFVDRYLKSRYRQMVLGSAWAVLEPLMQLLLMTVVFGALLRINTNGYPYPVFVFAALIPYQHFSRTAVAVTGSLQENMALISKVYFPRIILPVAAMFREVFDTLIQLVILLVLASFYGFYPSIKLLLIAPLALVLISLGGAGLGLIAAAIVVRYRDVRPALGILLQGGMYLSPVLYAATVVPEWLKFYYQLNPMYWAVELFRWLLLNQPLQLSWAMPIALLLAFAVLITGLVVFSFNERDTVDVL